MFTPRLNHCFSGEVKHCLNKGRASHNRRMDKKPAVDNKKAAEDLAKRIRMAMDNRVPPLGGSELAEACGVTPQAVSGWRKNGRVHKRHLETLAELTGKPLEHFLVSDKKRNGMQSGALTHHEEFQTIKRAWENASQDQRAILLTVATGILERNAKRRKRAG